MHTHVKPVALDWQWGLVSGNGLPRLLTLSEPLTSHQSRGPGACAQLKGLAPDSTLRRVLIIVQAGNVCLFIDVQALKSRCIHVNVAQD